MNKIIGSIVIAGTLGLGILGGAYMFPVTHTVEKPVEVIKTVEVLKEVPVDKIIYQDKVVSVDNGNLDKVMNFIEDNFDEDVTVEYIVFETDARIQAEAYIYNHFLSMLKDEDYFDDGNLLDNYRTSEVSIKKISDATVLDRDFEDKDLTLQYEVTVKAKENGEDRQYFNFTVTVPFDNGILQDEDIEFE